MTPERLRDVRKKHFRETQAEFAERTGIAERTLGRYESGTSPIPMVVGFAIAARLYDLPPWGFKDPSENR